MHERTRLFWLFLAGGVAIGGVAIADPFGGSPHRFQADTVISASQMNANFDAITTHLNHLESELASTKAELAELTTETTIPAGTIIAFGGPKTKIPEGWELCDGRQLNPTAPEYEALFAAIGTAHGGNGNTTFHLPDYRGIFLRGVDDGRNKDPNATMRTAAATGGNTGAAPDAIGSVQADALQNVTAQFQLRATQGGATALGPSGAIAIEDAGNGNGRLTSGSPLGPIHQLTFDASRVARTSTETRPLNAAVHYIIKL